MFVHSVYFWLKSDLTDEEHRTFVEGLESLTAIETVKVAHTGTPADTDRPIIVRSYSYALILFFDDKAAHDAYQIDPVHDAFRETCGTFWSEVRIYDSTSAEA